MNIKDMNKCNAHKTKDPEMCITDHRHCSATLSP